MKFTEPLTIGILEKRYKRFLADVILPDGNRITAHCPNTGTMKGCSTPGSRVALSKSDNPKRKYAYTFEMIEEANGWVGVNTARTNKLVAEAIEKKLIDQWQDVESLRAEVKISPQTRLDLQLTHSDKSTTLVEIKNCSLAEIGCAKFPDAVTARGTKHLNELKAIAENGQKAAIFYLVQRMDADCFRPAKEIDPLYADTFLDAQQAGVGILIYQARVTLKGIEVVRQLPLRLDAK